MADDLHDLDDLRTDDVASGTSAGAGVSQLQFLTKLCGAQACPTVYRSDRGTLVVQGYAVSAERAGRALPEGELLVEIPLELLKQAADLVS